MNGHRLSLAAQTLIARPSGALFLPAQDLLVVSDLHLGKAGRRARAGAVLLPPYETAETLHRLALEVAETGASRVICLGDSFDDPGAASALSAADAAALSALQAGRDWLWLEGNHDRGQIGPGGQHVAALSLLGLNFRHIASPAPVAAGSGEISGHFHPKASLSLRGAHLSRPCFLYDGARLIMPAFGTYTGGLSWTAPEFAKLLAPEALAILTGQRTTVLRLPRRAKA